MFTLVLDDWPREIPRSDARAGLMLALEKPLGAPDAETWGMDAESLAEQEQSEAAFEGVTYG